VEIRETGVLSGSASYDSTPEGEMTFTQEGRNLKVHMKDEILTVNGKQYVLANKDDAITIKDGRVEINGKPVKPMTE
jgi:hypothetical protein